MQEAIGRAREQQGLERAGLFAMLLLVESLHYVFARLLLPHLPPMASSMYVLGVATVQVGIFAAVRGKLDWHPAARHFWFFAGIGFFIATSTLLNYIAVEYIDVGTASMLGKTGVIISLLLGVFWLRERLSRQQVVGAALAVAGATIVSYHPGDIMQFGSLLILTSTFLYALHTALVKRYGQQMDFTEFFFHRLMFTTVFLFVFAALGRQLVWPDGQTWLLLLLAGTVDVVISRALYYTTLRMFSMSVHTIILTLSPVVSIVISLFLFGTFPGLQELLGGALVLAGVFVVTRGRQ
jgi:drug/metabolite transporter (DMT)-like permease